MSMRHRHAPLHNVSSMTTAAFFDLDNTVVRGSSLFPLAWSLVRSGRISSSEMVRFASMNARFVGSRTESVTSRDYVMHRALSLVSGQSVQSIHSMCDELVPHLMRRRLNAHVVAEIDRHKFSGNQTWLVTASPIELAERIARALGMTGALGTQAAHVGGFYTGELCGPILHGPNKARAVSALANVESLVLSRCSAYSDSINDLPLLVMVGRPTVVNANRRLRQIALRNGWGVLTGRRTLALETAAA